jgi:hypothetical protein
VASSDRSNAVVGAARAALEGGHRTASLVAVTPCRVAVASPTIFDVDDLAGVARGHRNEEA